MPTCFLKRFVPFMLTLILGSVLASLLSVAVTPSRNIRCTASLEPAHSKTWLVIRHVPVLKYTEQEARANGALAPLRLRALLDVDGTVSDVELLPSAAEEFAGDAMNAARGIKFIPATEDRQPIPLWVTVDYECHGDSFGHHYVFQCSTKIAQVERDWRIIYE